MSTFARAGEPVLTTLARVMEQYHGELCDAELAVDVLLAYGPRDTNGDLCGPAIKRNGIGVIGQTRVINLRDRVAGRGDIEILLDGDCIDELEDDEIAAIIDHELTHVELKIADDGSVKRDDIERPCVRLRPHDREFGWFDATARRYGEKAVEVKQARQLLDREDLRQLYLPGLDVGAV